MRKLAKACTILENLKIPYRIRFDKDTQLFDVIPQDIIYIRPAKKIKIDFEHAFTAIPEIDILSLKSLIISSKGDSFRLDCITSIAQIIINTILRNKKFCYRNQQQPMMRSDFFNLYFVSPEDMILIGSLDGSKVKTIGLKWDDLVFVGDLDNTFTILYTIFHEIGHVITDHNLKLASRWLSPTQNEFCAYYFQNLFWLSFEKIIDKNSLTISDYIHIPYGKTHSKAFFMAERFFWLHQYYYRYPHKRDDLPKESIRHIKAFEKLFK